MKDLDDVLEDLPRPPITEVVDRFVPAARFASKGFEDYQPRHPTQEEARRRLRLEADRLNEKAAAGWLSRTLDRWRRPRVPGGIYLDGGFGVGKTHLLAALWRSAPDPKSYLSFDELVYFIGLVGVDAASDAFQGRNLVAVDEWELDDPGNLKLALAFLRGALARDVFVAVTSNTLPLELGAGRFSQKDFRAEIEELSGAFEVVRIEGDDYRRRHFEAHPGRGYFASPREIRTVQSRRADGTSEPMDRLLPLLSRVHPIRFAEIARRLELLVVCNVKPIQDLADALRWVHFVDSLYDSRVMLVASGKIPLEALFPADAMSGPYGKKLSRCLSRMEEMLTESRGLFS